jgi:stage II sporulation protein D
MDAAAELQIRVLLADRIARCCVTGPAALSIIDRRTNKEQARFEQGALPVQIAVTCNGIRIAGSGVGGDGVAIVPDRPHVFTFDGKDYRGRLEITVRDEGKSFDVINVVPLEAYLGGVVGAEMPDYWEPAALQAQAIAARTYCLYIKREFGRGRNWDVLRSQANQVYLGLEAESPRVWDAIEKTYGMILVGAGDDSEERLLPSYYSSTCGGHTENSKNVFGDSFEPLAGVRCPYCRYVARPVFYFWPRVEFDKTAVSRRLLERYPSLTSLGEITNIIIAQQSSYGRFARATSVRLVGSTGASGFLRGEDFRLAIDPSGTKLRSASFQIKDEGNRWAFVAGRGYGHGVGMCQCGAQAMARAGKTAEQILSFYYPSAGIVSVYTNGQF